MEAINDLDFREFIFSKRPSNADETALREERISIKEQRKNCLHILELKNPKTELEVLDHESP